MRTFLGGLAGVVLAASQCAWGVEVAGGTCHQRELAIPDGATATGGDTTRITLLAINPPEGAEVRASTTLEFDVEYHIARFEPGKYSFLVRFPTNTLGSMSPGDSSDMLQLSRPSGRAHLCVPLEEVFNSQGVRWPLSVTVSIDEQAGDYTQIIANSRTVRLNAVDVRPDQIEASKSTPSEEYQEAIALVFGFTENLGALNKVCPARFPDLAGSFTKEYRAWESRHAELIRQVQEAQFELFESSGSRGYAATAFDMARTLGISHYNQRPLDEMRDLCAAMQNAFDGPANDPEVVFREQLVVIRAGIAGGDSQRETR